MTTRERENPRAGGGASPYLKIYYRFSARYLTKKTACVLTSIVRNTTKYNYRYKYVETTQHNIKCEPCQGSVMSDLTERQNKLWSENQNTLQSTKYKLN